jgi:6-phosphogluconolactonase (cycloisomerase 2 family)
MSHLLSETKISSIDSEEPRIYKASTREVKTEIPVKSIATLALIMFLAGCTSNPSFSNSPSSSSNPSPNGSPAVATISPTSAIAGGAAFTLTVNGTNFVSASMVRFGSTALTITFVSSTELIVTIPAAAIATTGTAPVRVTSPAPGGGTSNSVNFTISGGNPVPTIALISPNSAVAGGAAFTLTVNGTNFVPASLITFGGTARTTTFVSSTSLTASVDAAAVATAVSAQVFVTNPALGGGNSNSVNFSISGGPNPIPTISGLSPNVATVGGPAFTLTVGGSSLTSFVASSVVRWNGSDRLTSFVNSSQLTAEIPASDIDAIGTAAVTVFNPEPGGGVSNAATFTIGGGGVRPTSVAVAPDSSGNFGKFAYVVNTGTSNISMYDIDPTTGALNSRGTITTGSVPSSVSVDPSGQFVYVTNSAFTRAGNVSVYAINADGTLTPNGTTPAGLSPHSIAIDPLGRFAYLANSVGACTAGSFSDVSMFTINGDGTLTPTSPATIAAGVCPSAVAIDRSGKFAYAANADDCGDFLVGSISIYKINPAFGGILSSTGTIDAGACPLSLAMAPDPSGKFGGFVYVADSQFSGASNVLMYTIDSVTGLLVPITPGANVAAGTDSRYVAVDPSGKFVYVANFGSNDVSMYTVDAATGALKPISSGTVTAGVSPVSIAIDPSGKFVYVVNFGSNDISVYGIDAATGALTLIATTGT